MFNNIQAATFRELYLNIARDNNVQIDLQILREMNLALLSSEGGKPLFRPYTLQPESPIDFDEFNKSTFLLSVDTQTLIRFTDWLYERIKMMEFVRRINESRTATTLNEVLIKAEGLAASFIIPGISKRLNFTTDINIDSSTIKATEGAITTGLKAGQTNVISIAPNELQLSFAGQRTGIQSNGSQSDMFNPDIETGYIADITSSVVNPIRMDLIINKQIPEINSIEISTNDIMKDCKVVILDVSGSTEEVIKESILRERRSVIIFPTITTSRLGIRIYQERNTSRDGQYNYQFAVDKILLRKVVPVANQVFVSNELIFDRGIGRVSLIVTDQSESPMKIEYFVSADRNSAGDPVGFRPIVPINKKEDPLNIVDIGQGVGYLRNLQPTNGKWEPPIMDLGGTDLYSILEAPNLEVDGSGSSGGNIEITGQRLVVTGDKGQIIEESLRIYRGIEDWAIIRDQNRIASISTNATAYLEKITIGSTPAGYKAFDIPVFVEQIVTTQKSDETLVVLSSPPIDTVYITLLDLDNNDLQLGIDATKSKRQINGAYYLYLDEPLSSRIRFKVKYKTTLVSRERNGRKIEIDPRQLVVRNGTTIYRQGIDYTIDLTRKQIRIDESVPDAGNVQVDITYYTILDKLFPIYETYIIVDDDTDISVIPFTEEEIFAGNFHQINDRDASRSSTLTLTPGTHRIRTTQVIPSIAIPGTQNYVFTNVLTNKASAAAVIIPEGIYYRAFTDPLRRVSMFDLAHTVTPDDERSFAYQDGRIYLNRIPECPDSVATTGKNILGIRALYSEDNTLNSDLTPQELLQAKPEIFDLEVSIELNELPKSMFVRGVISTTRQGVIKDFRISDITVNNLNLTGEAR